MNMVKNPIDIAQIKGAGLGKIVQVNERNARRPVFFSRMVESVFGIVRTHDLCSGKHLGEIRGGIPDPAAEIQDSEGMEISRKVRFEILNAVFDEIVFVFA